MTRVFLGFDPGGRNTGIVLRRRDALLGSKVVVRTDKLTVADGGYTAKVAAAALGLLKMADVDLRDPELVVVSEGVRYWPKQRHARGHQCPACKLPHGDASADRNLTGLLGAAVVHGSILARWSSTVVVPPGSGHGSLHDTAYPEAIRAPGKGSDLNQHARSAWDATHHGETLYNRQRRRTA